MRTTRTVCVLGALGLMACAIDPVTKDNTDDDNDNALTTGTTKQAVAVALTIDVAPLSDPPGQQLAIIMDLGVQTTNTASFSAEPGTYSLGSVVPGFSLGTFTVAESGITATTGVLVASTPTSLTVDPSRLAQVRIPLSEHVDPPSPFLFTGRFNIPIHNPPMFGGPFSGGDVRFTLPDGHYIISNGWFGLPPFNWGSFDVVNSQLSSAGEGFRIAANGQLAVDRCAFAAVNFSALPPPMGMPFQMPGLFQSPLPAFGGTFFLPRGLDYTVTAPGRPEIGSFTIPPAGPITNVVNAPFITPIVDAPPGSCEPPPPPPPPLVACIGSPDNPVRYPQGTKTCGVEVGGRRGLAAGSCTALSNTCTWNGSTGGQIVTPSFFPTPINVTGTAADGRTESCTSWIQITDSTPPTLKTTVSPTQIKADKKLHLISIVQKVKDLCGTQPVSCYVTSSDPNTTPDDIQWVDGQLYLRGEKTKLKGRDADRVYYINCSVSDTAGTATTTTTVLVPAP